MKKEKRKKKKEKRKKEKGKSVSKKIKNIPDTRDDVSRVPVRCPRGGAIRHRHPGCGSVHTI